MAITKLENMRLVTFLCLGILSPNSFGDEVIFQLVENFKKGPQLNRSIEFNKKTFQVAIEATLQADTKAKLLDSKILYSVKDHDQIVWQESLDGKYNLEISQSSGEILFSNYISTKMKSHSNWTILSRRFAKASVGNKPERLTFWAIIINGNPGRLDFFDDSSKYDDGKPYLVIKLKNGTAVIVNLGSITTTDSKI